jgi:nucleotide-binding universal stress UspA family protein
VRVLLATDGSRSAESAVHLVGSLPWPAGSTIQVVSVVRAVYALSMGAPGLVASPDTLQLIADSAIAEAKRVAETTAAAVAGPGRTVMTTVIEGRPANVITELARESGADLIVLGRQGRGAIASVVLGSVSTEVVETARCPVLVVQSASIDRLVLADDGSRDAGVARRLVATMPGFRGKAARVVSVGEVSPDWFGWLEPVAGPDTQAFEEAIVRDGDRARDVATGATEQLRTAGITTESDARSGDAAHEIVASATEFRADLIVLGRRGQTALDRLLLGSVARSVLHRAHCSVLVVPKPAST